MKKFQKTRRDGTLAVWRPGRRQCGEKGYRIVWRAYKVGDVVLTKEVIDGVAKLNDLGKKGTKGINDSDNPN